MKKLMLSVAVFMMGVSTLGLYAQDSNVEPVKKDSVPTEEPKKEEPKSEAAWVCMGGVLIFILFAGEFIDIVIDLLREKICALIL